MDFDTTMFFLAEAPSLLRPGVADTIRATTGGEALTKVINLGRTNGVKFLCCSVSAKVIWNIDDDGLPEGMEFAGAATLLEMAVDPEVAVLYF
jgi:predicted peroxiredoxin